MDNDWFRSGRGFSSDKRKEKRRTVSLPSLIVLPQECNRLRCVVTDLSQSGASISIEHADQLPDDFVLFLAASESMRRVCTVVRRGKTALGVRFQKR
jgi:hypothetical protein